MLDCEQFIKVCVEYDTPFGDAKSDLVLKDGINVTLCYRVRGT